MHFCGVMVGVERRSWGQNISDLNDFAQFWAEIVVFDCFNSSKPFQIFLFFFF